MAMLSDQELISAYLDGELSGEELARAENLLATQPESRQLLEELQSLRTSLQALPQQTLGSGFADAVLRRAEREMLQPTRSIAPTTPMRQDDDRPSFVSWQRWQRPLAWSALTIAAALLIMLFSPDQRQVAIAPAPPGGELNAPAAVEFAARNAPAAAPAQANGKQGQAAGHVGERAESGYFALSKAGGQASEDLPFQVLAATNELLVVHCDIPAGADGEQALREILATHDIQWESATTDKLARTPRFAEPSAREDKEVAVQTPAREGQRQEPPQDAIYVVADSQQLADTLGAMASNNALRHFVVEHVPASAEALADFDSPAPESVEAEPSDQEALRGTAKAKTGSDAASEGVAPAMAGKPGNATRSLGKDNSGGGLGGFGAATPGQVPKMNEQAGPSAQRAESAHQGRAARVDLAEFESQMQLPDASVRARPMATDQDGDRTHAVTPADAAPEDKKQLQAPRSQSRALFLLRSAPQRPTEDKP
jgi:negative regulator of sigma E activity